MNVEDRIDRLMAQYVMQQPYSTDEYHPNVLLLGGCAYNGLCRELEACLCHISIDETVTDYRDVQLYKGMLVLWSKALGPNEIRVGRTIGELE